jgi:hypothetical protein
MELISCVKAKTCNVTIIQCCAPKETVDAVTKQTFRHLLHETIKKPCKRDMCVMMGDTNTLHLIHLIVAEFQMKIAASNKKFEQQNTCCDVRKLSNSGKQNEFQLDQWITFKS